EAALFGYFLALLPKSNSPVGENPRLHSAKAEQCVMPWIRFRGNDESMVARDCAPPRYALLRGATRGERVGLIQKQAKLDPCLRGDD
ncbi:MAG TPA: hypothetical protein VNX47_11705, partial [Nevskia sp.]|nr:hypothetical protein [Nevskia sp.]